MDLAEKKMNRQIQFWALVGPLITLLTFMVLMKKVSTHSLYLPVLILSGFPICWKWKIKGFAISLLLLCAFFAVSYNSIPLEDRFWQFGMGMAITLSFAVTALSFEEVEALVKSLQVESGSRLTNLLHMDEKFKASEEKLNEECELLKSQINELHLRLHEKELTNQRQQKLIEIVRAEILAAQAQRENILNELFEKRNQVEVLTRNQQPALISELENLKQSIVGKEEAICQLDVELDKVKTDLLQEQVEKTNYQSLLIENENHQNQLAAEMKDYIAALVAEKNSLENHLSKLHTDKQIEIQKLIETYQNAITSLTQSWEKTNEELELQKRQTEDIQALIQKYQTDLTQSSQAEAEIKHKIMQLQQQLAEKDQQNHQLNSENKTLETMLAQVKTDTKPVIHVESTEMDRELRRMKGLYEQLKEQFAEKSTILDETRRHLFVAEEKLLENQIILREKEVYGYSETEAGLVKQLVATKKEAQRQYEEAVHEIEQLYQFIDKLVVKS